MTSQEENWELMTLLGVRWNDAKELEGEDRTYLLARANEIKVDLMKRREQEMQMQNQMRQQHQTSVPPQ
tara:strand:- start:270 stop:476 length:207 start_codon:yes stop_codon:yes gene_type:complete